jgi:hypothetical protein
VYLTVLAAVGVRGLFRKSKVTSVDGAKSLEVAAFGKEFSWSPFHSRADLLWVDGIGVTLGGEPQIAPIAESKGLQAVPDGPAADKAASRESSVTAAGAASAPMTGWYTFKVQVLFDLIERLDDQQELTDREVLALVGTKAKTGAEEYRRFLRSGELIPAKAWTATPELQKLAIALRQGDISAARAVLKAVPSVSRFLESLEKTGSRKWDSSTINRGAQTYMTLGEVLLAGASISKEGYYPTQNRPSAREFSGIALERFKSLDTGEGLISTGKWLESLIVESGIHPEVSRNLLKEASAAGLLQRSTEGSTTDTGHDDHKISVLRLKDGRPVVESVHLYRGDYQESIEAARNPEMRSALHRLAAKPGDLNRANLFRDWLLGLRILKNHREELDVQFRLDTVESKTGALRDVVIVSSKVGLLEGIFLLLDELEKQNGVLGATAVVRYLSSLRAIIDALPQHLFMMLAVTPDAMIRYSSALPAFKSRLQNPILLQPLDDDKKALELANFYVTHAREMANKSRVSETGGTDALVEEAEIKSVFQELRRTLERRAETGVRQRDFLHALHGRAERVIAESARDS